METTKSKETLLKFGTYVILYRTDRTDDYLYLHTPAGTYDFAEDGKTVIPGTYHHVESNPAGIMDFFTASLRA